MPIKNWSTTAGSNNAATPNGWPEGQAPSTVNDCARQMMADIRTQMQDAEWFDWGDVPSRASATSFKVPTDVTTKYLAGRRMKLYDATTLYGTVASSSYSAPDTTINVTMDSGSLTTSLTSVGIAILSPANRSLPVVDLDTLTVSGAALFKGTVTISGAAVFNTTVTISGAAVCKTTLTVEGGATISATLVAKGLKYPTADGTARQKIITNASGVLSFASSGMELISLQTASASATIDFTSLSSSSFDSYLLVCDRVVPATDGVNLLVRVSVAATFQATNYVDQSWRWTASGSGASGSTTDTGFPINSTSETVGTGALEDLNAWFYIGNCAQATTTKRAMWHSVYQSSGDVEIAMMGGGRTATTSAVDGLRVLFDVGNIASGTFALYGLNNT